MCPSQQFSFSLWFQFSWLEYTAAIEILEEIKHKEFFRDWISPFEILLKLQSLVVFQIFKNVSFCANYLYYFKHILTFAELASKMLHRNALWQMATCT